VGGDDVSALARRLRRMDRATRDRGRLDHFAKWGTSVRWPDLLARLNPPTGNLIANPYAIPGSPPLPGDYDVSGSEYTGEWRPDRLPPAWDGTLHDWSLEQSADGSGVMSTPATMGSWYCTMVALMTPAEYDADYGAVGTASRDKLSALILEMSYANWGASWTGAGFARLYPSPMSALPAATEGSTYKVRASVADYYTSAPSRQFAVGIQWIDASGGVISTDVGAPVTSDTASTEPAVWYRNADGSSVSGAPTSGAQPSASLVAPVGTAKARAFLQMWVDSYSFAVSDFRLSRA
jgi:hypothetical protein